MITVPKKEEKIDDLIAKNNYLLNNIQRLYCMIDHMQSTIEQYREQLHYLNAQSPLKPLDEIKTDSLIKTYEDYLTFLSVENYKLREENYNLKAGKVEDSWYMKNKTAQVSEIKYLVESSIADVLREKGTFSTSYNMFTDCTEYSLHVNYAIKLNVATRTIPTDPFKCKIHGEQMRHHLAYRAARELTNGTNYDVPYDLHRLIKTEQHNALNDTP